MYFTVKTFNKWKCGEVFKILAKPMGRYYIKEPFERIINLLEKYDMNYQNTFDTENIEKIVRTIDKFC